MTAHHLLVESTQSQACVCVCVSSAYKEKVKELPLVSLFCSCLNPQTVEKPTYKAEGKNKALTHTYTLAIHHCTRKGHYFKVIMGNVEVLVVRLGLKHEKAKTQNYTLKIIYI